MNPRYTTSPFPGMNPYLEGPANWSDFHATFIQALREHIASKLPEPYFARADTMAVMLAPDLPQSKGMEPDVLIARDHGFGEPGEAASVATLEPTRLQNIEYLDPHTEAFIEIVRLPERERITVIELFSPTNKSGDGRGFYMEKPQALLKTDVNIVELDLLRGGRRLQLNRTLPPDHYYAFVSRGNERPSCDVYHWCLRSAFPMIPVPLRAPQKDVQVNLSEPFRVAFERGQYGRFIDYDQTAPPPALTPEDAAWLRSLTESKFTNGA
jgi:hypothetical protein